MALAAFSGSEPILPSEQEIQLAQESSRTLAAFTSGGNALRLNISNGDVEITLPPSAVRLLVDILTNMAEGNAVTLIPIHTELTTQQAAELLNVSRKFLIDELLEKGIVPFRKVGTHRRILFKHLMDYKQEHQAKRVAAIDKMVQLDQSLGLY
jgi:excisionase family DNA binding protein